MGQNPKFFQKLHLKASLIRLYRPGSYYRPGSHYRFLYTERDHPDTWTFGFEKSGCSISNLSSVEPRYRAPASAGKPASTQWKDLESGESYDWKVVEVKNIGANELEKRIWREGGYETEEGTIICWRTSRVLIITKDDCQRCNINRDCDSGFDEDNCPLGCSTNDQILIFSPIFSDLVCILYIV